MPSLLKVATSTWPLDGQGVGLMVGGDHALEDLLGILAVLGKDIVAGHKEAGGGVGVAVAEGKVLGAGKHVVDVLDATVLAGHDVGPVAVVAVGVGGLGKDFAASAVHHDHGALVANPAYVNLLEAHALDDAGVVAGKEGIDLHAQSLAHVGKEGIPKGTQILGGFGRNDAKVQFLLFRGAGCACGNKKQCGKEKGQKTSAHA